LKIRFQPKQDADGVVRLYLLDQAGWYVSDDVGSSTTPWKQMLGGISHSLVLENINGEQQVIVPNYDVHRPEIEGVAFSTEIICDRASMGWQQVMDTRYYLYPLHTSRSFLHTCDFGLVDHVLLVIALT
jgi:hypothetical protein